MNLQFLSFVDRFRLTSSTSRADLLFRTHPIRLSGTVIASSAVLPYMYVSVFSNSEYFAREASCSLDVD